MCAGLCPTYVTALDDAEENRNGRRPSTEPQIGPLLFTTYVSAVGELIESYGVS